jgi:uncharacterized RDD family membrane protein YckC
MTSTTTTALPAPWAARGRAAGWDYLVIVGWLAVLTLVGMAVRLFLPGAGTIARSAVDVSAFLFSVLPVWLYLTLTEVGPRQASWGKRRAGLRVEGPGSGRAGGRRIAVRNGVKLLPWQLAHLAVARLILGVDAPVLVAVTYGLSLLVPVVSIGIAWRDPVHRGLHDLAAGTRVVRA